MLMAVGGHKFRPMRCCRLNGGIPSGSLHDRHDWIDAALTASRPRRLGRCCAISATSIPLKRRSRTPACGR